MRKMRIIACMAVIPLLVTIQSAAAQSDAKESDMNGHVLALSPKVYIAAALESVRSQRPDREFHIEVIGEPIMKPDCSTFHAKELRTRAITNAPDATVLVSLQSGDVVREQARVVFEGNRPVPIFFSPRDHPWSKAIMDKKELEQIARELESFFATAVDVSRGSERFYQYFPDDIRSLLKHPDRKFRMYMPAGAVASSWGKKLADQAAARGVKPSPIEGLDGWGEQLTDEELRRFVALQLDALVQQSLLLVEGYSREASDQAARQRPQALVSNPREFIKSLEAVVSENRHLLEKAGVLNPEHLRLTSDYMRILIGKGFILKEAAKPDPCPCFQLSPEDAALYVTPFSPLSGNPALHFSRTGGNLRLACIGLP